MVKHSIYAILGAVMVLTAVLVRNLAGGGLELGVLLVIGIALLVASADLPSHTKGVTR